MHVNPQHADNMKKRYNNNFPRLVEDLEIFTLSSIFLFSILALTPAL